MQGCELFVQDCASAGPRVSPGVSVTAFAVCCGMLSSCPAALSLSSRELPLPELASPAPEMQVGSESNSGSIPGHTS